MGVCNSSTLYCGTGLLCAGVVINGLIGNVSPLTTAVAGIGVLIFAHLTVSSQHQGRRENFVKSLKDSGFTVHTDKEESVETNDPSRGRGARIRYDSITRSSRGGSSDSITGGYSPSASANRGGRGGSSSSETIFQERKSGRGGYTSTFSHRGTVVRGGHSGGTDQQ